MLDCSIRGVFQDNFPGFSGFGFRRKLARTKTQQGTDNVSEHNGCTVFFQALLFCTHQQKWNKLCFISDNLFVLLPDNIRQLGFGDIVFAYFGYFQALILPIIGKIIGNNRQT